MREEGGERERGEERHETIPPQPCWLIPFPSRPTRAVQAGEAPFAAAGREREDEAEDEKGAAGGCCCF